ncbi:HDOD domain-containing protein [Rheinheimera muenzenbergensis]|uniref:HDOD domain-containing protein n=1 Tax=Rheinheimera muenzenbergensis TaxID=1193628 RepID=A0ABU8C936_9GAMM
MKKMIDNATNLPSIPKVMQELIATLNDPNLSSNKISQIIANDQAITAKVLRIANSVRYGGHRKVGSVKDAVVVMGIDALKTLIFAIGLTSAIKAPEGFNLNAFWLRSFKMANRSKWLAGFIKADAELSYTCGLLHAIGEYLIHVVKPEQAIVIDKRVNTGESRSRLERDLLGFDYTQAGSELAEHWHFPSEIVRAIRWQEEPLAAAELSPYAACVHLAHYMTDHQQHIQNDNFDDFPVKLAHALHLKLSDMFSALKNAPDMDEGIEEFLS